MTEPVTLEQVETLVVRLPPKDQLKLLAHISERLSDTLHGRPAFSYNSCCENNPRGHSASRWLEPPAGEPAG